MSAAAIAFVTPTSHPRDPRYAPKKPCPQHSSGRDASDRGDGTMATAPSWQHILLRATLVALSVVTTFLLLFSLALPFARVHGVSVSARQTHSVFPSPSCAGGVTSSVTTRASPECRPVTFVAYLSDALEGMRASRGYGPEAALVVAAAAAHSVAAVCVIALAVPHGPLVSSERYTIHNSAGRTTACAAVSLLVTVAPLVAVLARFASGAGAKRAVEDAVLCHRQETTLAGASAGAGLYFIVAALCAVICLLTLVLLLFTRHDSARDDFDSIAPDTITLFEEASPTEWHHCQQQMRHPDCGTPLCRRVPSREEPQEEALSLPPAYSELDVDIPAYDPPAYSQICSTSSSFSCSAGLALSEPFDDLLPPPYSEVCGGWGEASLPPPPPYNEVA